MKIFSPVMVSRLPKKDTVEEIIRNWLVENYILNVKRTNLNFVLLLCFINIAFSSLFDICAANHVDIYMIILEFSSLQCRYKEISEVGICVVRKHFTE